MALKLIGFLVFAIAETMGALEWVLALMAELVGYQFFLSPKLLAANGAGQVGVSHTFLIIFEVLRYVGRNRDLVPVESDPLVELGEPHVLGRVVSVRGQAVIETVDIVESTGDLDLDLIGTF